MTVEECLPARDWWTREMYARFGPAIYLCQSLELQRLTGIRQTLVLQGDDDLMIPTPGSHTLAGLIPDAAHASLFQYPARVAADVEAFLRTG